MAVLAVAALAVLHAGGAGGFATAPAGALALAAAAVVSRQRTALAVALLVYLVAAVVAAATQAPVAVALWGAVWIPPLAFAQVAASSAVRRPGAAVWEHRLVVGVLGLVTLSTLLLTAPADPFTEVPAIAPEAWRLPLAPVGDVLTALGLVALLVLPVRLGRAAWTSTGPARAALGVAAAGTTAAPLTVVFCVLLAVARNPGAVDPEQGSVAFLVALSACACFSVAAAVLASGAVSARWLRTVLRVVALAVAGLVVAGVGTLVTAVLAPTAAALAVAALTVVVAGGAWFGAERIAVVLTPAEPDPGPAEPTGVPGLTKREAEVLGLLADGASNAGIAARLVVSERTVDAHLRSVFTKLELHPAPDANRRVQAARIWMDHAGPARTPG
ncbi:helix-turn-helix transcriptional regulator [Pseudonocardia endophytica]|uniref:Regulatory LuxR family protein n=1 Tax=Pseudonocardia endophytica TaxID=401976 RepID=A0A4R1I9L4_PSEEN|nr:helix-turn-helix transcriptional regulator [Pseudonocardia endophytica]TCK26952.1 regulatory LuxR family protein [Pseudonocardia endophytica]